MLYVNYISILKIGQIVHCTYVQFVICQLCINKAVFKKSTRGSGQRGPESKGPSQRYFYIPLFLLRMLTGCVKAGVAT